MQGRVGFELAHDHPVLIERTDTPSQTVKAPHSSESGVSEREYFSVSFACHPETYKYEYRHCRVSDVRMSCVSGWMWYHG